MSSAFDRLSLVVIEHADSSSLPLTLSHRDLLLAEQDSPSGDERIAQEVREVALVGIFRHGAPDRHH